MLRSSHSGRQVIVTKKMMQLTKAPEKLSKKVQPKRRAVKEKRVRGVKSVKGYSKGIKGDSEGIKGYSEGMMEDSEGIKGYSEGMMEDSEEIMEDSEEIMEDSEEIMEDSGVVKKERATMPEKEKAFTTDSIFGLNLTKRDVDLFRDPKKRKYVWKSDDGSKSHENERMRKIKETLFIGPNGCIVSLSLSIVSKTAIRAFLRIIIRCTRTRKILKEKHGEETALHDSLLCFAKMYKKDATRHPTVMKELHDLSTYIIIDLVAVDQTGARLLKENMTKISKSSVYKSEAHFRLSPPEKGDCIDHKAYFILHEDGIQCYGKSGIGNEFLCISLELVNCNQLERTARGLTVYSCIIQKRTDDDSMERMLGFMKEYIHTANVTGKEGVYFHYGGKWHHWRWSIVSICADSVAEEQIIGKPNKKNSKFPCIERDCCRMKLNIAEFNYMNFDAAPVIVNVPDLSIRGQALNCFGPRSGYRLASVVAHYKDPRKELKHLGIKHLEDETVREMDSVSSFLQLFKSSYIQWMPVLNNQEDLEEWRRNKLTEMFQSEGKRDKDDGIGDELNAYLRTVERSCDSGCDIHPEEELYLPKSMRFVQDQMHFVCNVAHALFNFLRGEGKSNKPWVVFFNQLIKERFFDEDATRSVELFGVDDWVMEKARKRMEALKCSNEYKWLNKILEKNKFEGDKMHNQSLFVFCLFPFAFQDSMRILSVFCVKNILDCLSVMFVFDEDYQQLMKVQSWLDFFSGILQGETNPKAVSPSMHGTDHTGMSVICHGPVAANNSYNQEDHYGEVKDNVVISPKVNKTVQLRIIASSACYLKGHVDRCCIRVITATVMEESLGSWVWEHVDMQLYIYVSKWNVNDDYIFYHCDAVPALTMIDQLVALVQEKTVEETKKILFQSTQTMKKGNHIRLLFSNHSNGLSEFVSFSSIICRQESSQSGASASLQLFRKISIDGQSIKCYTKRSILVTDTLPVSKSVAFLRLFNGKVAAFLVVGFSKEKLLDYEYYQALCIHIPTCSGSSFMETQHYGIVSSTTLTSLLEHPTVFPISVNRLVFNSAILLRFDAAATYFGIAFVKLCIRQCMPIPRDLLMEYLEGDACSRDYQTRSKNKQIKH